MSKLEGASEAFQFGGGGLVAGFSVSPDAATAMITNPTSLEVGVGTPGGSVTVSWGENLTVFYDDYFLPWISSIERGIAQTQGSP